MKFLWVKKAGNFLFGDADDGETYYFDYNRYSVTRLDHVKSRTGSFNSEHAQVTDADKVKAIINAMTECISGGEDNAQQKTNRS